jgi:hypothetical protein
LRRIFISSSRRRNRHIVSYVTVSVIPKMRKKASKNVQLMMLGYLKERARNNLNILAGLFAPDETISIVA